ncbi:hypothetical protein [[Clostridium] scindens]
MSKSIIIILPIVTEDEGLGLLRTVTRNAFAWGGMLLVIRAENVAFT